MARNYASYTLSNTAVGIRAGECPEADFSGGMNKGGSNAPAIGINTGDYNPKESDWTLLTQQGNPRTNQTSQHIAGLGLSGGGDSSFLVKAFNIDTGDDNDTFSFVAATTNTAPDGSLLGTTAAINKTGVTVPQGARCWGVNPVA